MKHAAILIVLVVGGYTAFQFMSPPERKSFRSSATKHVLRLAGLLLLVGMLIAVAVWFPASPLL